MASVGGSASASRAPLHRSFVRATRPPPPPTSSLRQFVSSRLAIAVLSVLATLFVLSIARSVSPPVAATTPVVVHDLTALAATKDGYHAKQKVLVLTPLKDAAPYLDEYFRSLARLRYPKHLVSLAFLVSDSQDATLPVLEAHARRLSAKALPPAERYASVHILTRDFDFNLATHARHGFDGQPVRRAFIARARNYLLTAALRHDHSWVLWLDVDVVRYDPDILMDLMSVDKDIVVPNTLWHQKANWDFWGFDRNNFAETEESLALIQKLGPEVMLVEGYRELVTARSHLVDMPTHLGLAHVPLDGIGCTFTLVKAHVHREGVLFPTYVVDNQVETEGLARVAKKAGFEVVGVPGLVVFQLRPLLSSRLGLAGVNKG